jgi:hypothetical protein
MQFDTVKAGVHYTPRSRRQVVLAAALQVGLTSGIIPEIPVRQPVVVLYGALHSILHADNRDWSPKSRYGCDLLRDSIR